MTCLKCIPATCFQFFYDVSFSCAIVTFVAYPNCPYLCECEVPRSAGSRPSVLSNSIGDFAIIVVVGAAGP